MFGISDDQVKAGSASMWRTLGCKAKTQLEMPDLSHVPHNTVPTDSTLELQLAVGPVEVGIFVSSFPFFPFSPPIILQRK
jgi:hypothetical protein